MKSTCASLAVLLLGAVAAKAQWDIPLPVTGSPGYPVTDTVYMSPEGDDQSPGTLDAPVATFSKALQLLPFGTPGVMGGNSYCLVRLLPGDYYAPAGMQQGESQWQQGDTYKNVSVEGIGEVHVYADPGFNGVAHALRLQGSHIFVRNIHLHQCTGVGLLINRGGASPSNPGAAHILLEDVTVDSTGSHGILLYNTSHVQVRNCRVLRASRLDFDGQPCGSWPSGLKFYFSQYITVQGCEVAYTRGEGLNFHNCEYGLAEDNHIHDNLTNIYNDNSARVIIRRNYVFNTPGATTYSHPCAAQAGQPAMQARGMLLGNEGACADPAHGPSFQFCSTLSCGGLFVEPYQVPTIDSTFIYNNIFHHCGGGIHLWEGSSTIPNPNCIKNIFVLHNTFWGLSGSPEAQGSWVSLFFPSYNFLLNSYGQLENLQCHGNVFAQQPDSFPLFKSLRTSFNAQGDFTYELTQNRWSASDVPPGEGNASVAGLYQAIAIDSLQAFRPACNSPSILPVPSYATWLDSDFFGQARDASWTNAGAVEADCAVAVADNLPRQVPRRIFPNPGTSQVNILCAEGDEVRAWTLTGQLLYEGRATAGSFQIGVAGWPPGYYLLEVGGHRLAWVKW